jgi:hypothetical protein
MRRRQAAFELAVATFVQAEECAGSQGIMHHAQPDRQTNQLRMMRGSQAARCAVTPAFEPAVAVSPLSCHVSNLAADGAGAPALAPSLI